MSSNTSDGRDLDCTNAKRGVWLVKVPKYVSAKWEKQPPMTEIGRLKINKTNNPSKPDIIFTLSEELVNKPNEPSSSNQKFNSSSQIPRDHRFAISDIKEQEIAVFSQNIDDNSLAMEGHVLQKGECRPLGDNYYMTLKKETIVNASKPEKVVQHLDKVVNSYKPVSKHTVDIEYEQRKKAEGKKSRDDKEKVQNMLFAAFEKHQYYNIKDLERITRQPLPYLKEILKDICNYNAKNPHKNMWELKPEFRHYNRSQEEDS